MEKLAEEQERQEQLRKFATGSENVKVLEQIGKEILIGGKAALEGIDEAKRKLLFDVFQKRLELDPMFEERLKKQIAGVTDDLDDDLKAQLLEREAAYKRFQDMVTAGNRQQASVIDRAFTKVGGKSGAGKTKQMVESPQLDKTNELLKNINNALRNGQLVARTV